MRLFLFLFFVFCPVFSFAGDLMTGTFENVKKIEEQQKNDINVCFFCFWFFFGCCVVFCVAFSFELF